VVEATVITRSSALAKEPTRQASAVNAAIRTLLGFMVALMGSVDGQQKNNQ